MINPLQLLRIQYHPVKPRIFDDLSQMSVRPHPAANVSLGIQNAFPSTYMHPILNFVHGMPILGPLKVGVVFSGGQAPGGHNVITGIFDSLHQMNPHSRLFGFLGGPQGILSQKWRELTEEHLVHFRNQGGFNLIGSGRTKIETMEQFQLATIAMRNLDLDGLVIIGGDDSNTNAALLAEYFVGNGVKTVVVGVPKTIDGDLKNVYIEASFGFDTAAKTYSTLIGNIAHDAISARKSYYFIKLMGRSASHLTLECALQTHPNLALIGEELEYMQSTLADVVKKIADVVTRRSEAKKDYGVILIPEGIIEFLADVKGLIIEINRLVASKSEDPIAKLSAEAAECWKCLPRSIQDQLLLERDPHGNVQVSKIEIERLLIELVYQELEVRRSRGEYKGKFTAQPCFFGYEGRSCYPSNFDANYCYSLGITASLLVQNRATGYIAVVNGLEKPPTEWTAGGIPLVQMIHFEERHGKSKPVIAKALVDLNGKPFMEFARTRDAWIVEDDYNYPGPIQFFGPPELTDSITQTLRLESKLL